MRTSRPSTTSCVSTAPPPPRAPSPSHPSREGAATSPPVGATGKTTRRGERRAMHIRHITISSKGLGPADPPCSSISSRMQVNSGRRLVPATRRPVAILPQGWGRRRATESRRGSFGTAHRRRRFIVRQREAVNRTRDSGSEGKVNRTRDSGSDGRILRGRVEKFSGQFI